MPSLPGNSITLSLYVSSMTPSTSSNFLVALPLSTEFPNKDWTRKCNSVHWFSKPYSAHTLNTHRVKCWYTMTGQGAHQLPAPTSTLCALRVWSPQAGRAPPPSPPHQPLLPSFAFYISSICFLHKLRLSGGRFLLKATKKVSPRV